MSAAVALLLRDLRLAWRDGADRTLALAFFFLAALLFPLGVGPEPQILARIAPGVIWATALLAALLPLDRLLQPDFDDGSLELLALAPLPLALLALVKAAVHWLTTGLMLLLATPVLAVMFGLDPAGLPVLLAAMLLGTLSLSLIGMLGAALTLGAHRGAALMPLLVLPLALPVLIFGAGAVEAELTGLGARSHLLVLGALTLGCLALTPFAASLAIRQALD